MGKKWKCVSKLLDFMLVMMIFISILGYIWNDNFFKALVLILLAYICGYTKDIRDKTTMKILCPDDKRIISANLKLKMTDLIKEEK